MQDSRRTESDQSAPPLADKQWQLLQAMLLEGQREQRRTRRWNVFFKLLLFAYLSIGLLMTLPLWSKMGDAKKDHVAVVRVEGMIADDAQASAAKINRGLRRAFDSKAKAVVLAINSPGGSPVQADQVFREVRRLRQQSDKPVFAVIGDVGASGAYYIAAAADEIYADRASLVGSIGVISAGFGFVDALEKFGLERRLFTAGAHKAMLDAFSPLKPDEEAFWRGVLEQTHQQFVSRVREGRGDRLADSPELFSGLIWSGEQAVQLGLIDGFASERELARERFGLEELRDYTVSRPPLERLMSMSAAALVGAVTESVAARALMLR